jgi:TonB family protein
MIPSILAFSANSLFRGALAHVWESSLVGLVVLGIIVACRAASADLRRALGWVGLLKFAVPAVVLAPLLGGVERMVERLAARPPGALVGALPGYRFLSMATATHHPLPAVLVDGLLGIWVVVSSILLVRWVLKAVAFRRELVARARPVPEGLSRRLAAAAVVAGVDSTPAVVVPSDSEGPGILGLFAPLLVLPSSLEDSLTPGELESILVHELVHLRRRDHLWGALRTCLLAVFWHNPVVWLLCRSVALETERACDEEVIRLTGAPQDYADGILKTVRLSLGPLDASLTGATGHSISSRIRSILNPQSKTESPSMKTIALSAACLVAVLSGFAGPSPDATAPSKPEAPAGQTFDMTKLDVLPKVLLQVRPVYPADMHAQGVNAEVTVDFIVDPAGAVRNAYALKSSRPEFARSAVEAVSQWRFEPGQVAGRKVNTHMQVPIVFTVTADHPNSKS